MSDDDPATTPLSRQCGAMNVHRRLLEQDTGYAANRMKIENQAVRAVAAARALGPLARADCREIPVVVHIVHNTDEQNISDAQVQSQIDVLNADFRKQNADVSGVPAVFAPHAADALITFVLASTDPDGNPTDGITRTPTDTTAFNHVDDAVKFDDEGKAAWPTDEYLNIWVCPLTGGLLGYAQFPGGPADTDGVVCNYRAFGTTGTAQAPFDLGRTTTHEVGHWLNLFHIWGDDGTGCHGTDHVADTPNQGGPNHGKPTFPTVSCDNGPDGDMFMNYMDYVDDDTMVMFTNDQVTRMRAALDGPRVTIGVDQSCDGGKPPFKEFPKDPPKEFPKEPPKEFPKEFPKEPPKEFPKDPPKEFPKEFPKDPPKEFPKEPPKDGPKEFPKDGPKDPIGEPPKGIFEPPKGVHEPPKSILEPPKGIFEPPKGVFEPPKGVFEPPKGVFEPPKGLVEGPQGPTGPGVPFVLGTGAAGAQAQAQRGQPQADVLALYQQVLGHYASLAQQGLLDEQGMAGWRAAWAAYQQLGGS